jgi:glycosyltransferase involved in cell wall biosynthesis
MVPRPGVSMSEANQKTGRRILQIAHSHPRFHPGGTELTALALHRKALKSGLDSWYLGALDDTQIVPNLGTQMIALSDDQREAALFTRHFRRFSLAQEDHFGFLWELRDYLKLLRPDVIHVHHLLNFGLEALYVIRFALPDARIILTIHDYYLICANDGQLYKHDLKQRCPGPTLTECLKCFPERNANDFAMRRLDIRNALSLCDVLVSPSYFLRQKFDRYLALPQAITVVENGYLGADIPPAERRQANDETVVFGYFGNISAVKGLQDLLDAADILLKAGTRNFRLNVHGSQLYKDQAMDDRIAAARLSLADQVRYFGLYSPEDMGGHFEDIDCLVFPSVWWENAPLVIYEALYHGRQVIAYPHGGAPEILARYGTGLLADRSNPHALAEAMQRIITDPSLTGMKARQPIPGNSELLDAYSRLYFN